MRRPTFTNFEIGDHVLSRPAFFRRWAVNLVAVLLFLLISLFAGMAGYHFTEHMGWLDAFANASMILSGMGPLGTLQTPQGKIFAGLYALYSGVAFIFTSGLILAPVAHRLLHRFHVNDDPKKDDSDDDSK